MSTKYKATTTEDAYFITITTVGWIDVFTRLNQKYVITNALKYCQEHKGLEIYAWTIMSSHLHLFCKPDGKGSIPFTGGSEQAKRIVDNQVFN